jgi:hypothetical protein
VDHDPIIGVQPSLSNDRTGEPDLQQEGVFIAAILPENRQRLPKSRYTDGSTEAPGSKEFLRSSSSSLAAFWDGTIAGKA